MYDDVKDDLFTCGLCLINCIHYKGHRRIQDLREKSTMELFAKIVGIVNLNPLPILGKRSILDAGLDPECALDTT